MADDSDNTVSLREIFNAIDDGPTTIGDGLSDLISSVWNSPLD